jgi:signal transduction histidine kinase
LIRGPKTAIFLEKTGTQDRVQASEWPESVGERWEKASHSLTHPKKSNYLSVATELPYVKGNALRLEQVVVNLLNNARQALSGDNKGIFVSTAIDQTQYMISITVRDEGCGMDKKTLERIKEPFFTTKGSAEGTGLGLSICNQIVGKHGGALKIESESGKGTVASILMPGVGAKISGVQNRD